ncbi:MAG: DUF3365 domain-containing protein [Desulfosoma sp.]
MSGGRKLITLAAVGFMVFVCVGAGASPSEEERARQLGSNAATELQRVLKSELMSAIQEGGPGQAIRVCSQKALLLTQSIPRLMDVPSMTVKRTSLRCRNEMNRPDHLETKILKEMEARLQAQEAVEPVLRLENKVYHYFEPIRTAGVCLTCHGQEEKMPENIKQTLNTLYPQDQARGYSAGEFRGVIHVTIPQEVVAEP